MEQGANLASQHQAAATLTQEQALELLLEGGVGLSEAGANRLAGDDGSNGAGDEQPENESADESGLTDEPTDDEVAAEWAEDLVPVTLAVDEIVRLTRAVRTMNRQRALRAVSRLRVGPLLADFNRLPLGDRQQILAVMAEGPRGRMARILAEIGSADHTGALAELLESAFPEGYEPESRAAAPPRFHPSYPPDPAPHDEVLKKLSPRQLQTILQLLSGTSDAMALGLPAWIWVKAAEHFRARADPQQLRIGANLARALSGGKHDKEALEIWEQCLAHAQGPTLSEARGYLLNTLGEHQLRRDHWNEARECFRSALECEAVRHNTQARTAVLTNLGSAALKLGEQEAAQKYYAEAINLAAGEGDWEGVLACCGNLSMLPEATGLLGAAHFLWLTLQREAEPPSSVLMARTMMLGLEGETELGIYLMGYIQSEFGRLLKQKYPQDDGLMDACFKKAFDDGEGMAEAFRNVSELYHLDDREHVVSSLQALLEAWIGKRGWYFDPLRAATRRGKLPHRPVEVDQSAREE
jgi:tetratricopeptide (TPR) repeat protein